MKLKNIKYKPLIIIILFIIIILLLNILTNNKILYELNNKIKKLSTGNDTVTVLDLETKEDNNVLLIFKNDNGIKKIVAPNGLEIYANGKKNMSIDYKVEKNMTYTFETIDTTNHVSKNSFTTPTLHIEMTNNDIDVDLKDIQSYIDSQLNEHLIATNFININTGERNYMNSNSTDMSEIFKNWNSFGDGSWSYQADSKTILNTKNSNYFTGYYFPNGQFEDIELSFNVMTTNSDDDMIGAMVRFSQNDSYNFSSYLFLLDSHDNGEGIGNGAYNGLNKIINNNLLNGSGITQLSVNPNLRWTRNKWQNYKIIAKGDLIEAYIDNSLVAQINDSSISKGTIGFVSYSQAYTYFKDIIIKTENPYNFTDLIDKVKWSQNDVNIIINLNNTAEPSLSDNNWINYFNANNIYYIGIGKDKSGIENFISNINNNGTYIESTDYDDYTQKLIDYILSII